MRQPYVCPKCDGEKPKIKNCAVCDGKGFVMADGDAPAVGRVIIKEIYVQPRKGYDLVPYPYTPTYSPYWWYHTTTTGGVNAISGPLQYDKGCYIVDQEA